MSFLDYNRKKTKLKLLNGERVHWIENNPRRDYIRQCVLSFPFWIKDKDLRPIWDEAKKIEKKQVKKELLTTSFLLITLLHAVFLFLGICKY